MKVLSVILFKQEEHSAILIHSTFEVSSFGYFEKSTVRELCQAGSRKLATKILCGQRATVPTGDSSFVCHGYCISIGGTKVSRFS